MIWFAEIARYLRMEKKEQRADTVDSETTKNPHDVEILVPTDGEAQAEGLSPTQREAIRSIRRDVVAFLWQFPAVVSAVREFSGADCLYRIRVGAENLHLVREGSDGITKPFLRDGSGKFVENMDLIRAPTPISGTIMKIVIQSALVDLQAKLDIVITNVHNLAELVRFANRGELEGAIHALEVARRLNDADHRRRQMLDACQEVLVQLGQVAGQMTAHVNQMPPADTGFRIGWDGGRITAAERAYRCALDDFAVLSEGLKQVVTAYVELGETAAAARAFSLLCGKVDTTLKLAADRARLLPYPTDGGGPEKVFESFLLSRAITEARLHGLAEGIRPGISLVFDQSELVI